MAHKKSIMYSLGAFVGHIGRAVATPVRSTKTGDVRELSRETEERTETRPDGSKVTLRRTTIDEVEVERQG